MCTLRCVLFFGFFLQVLRTVGVTLIVLMRTQTDQ